MRIEPEISSVSVILLGDFNPAIFTPAWFALHDLLPKGAAESADLNVAQVGDFLEPGHDLARVGLADR